MMLFSRSVRPASPSTIQRRRTTESLVPRPSPIVPWGLAAGGSSDYSSSVRLLPSATSGTFQAFVYVGSSLVRSSQIRSPFPRLSVPSPQSFVRFFRSKCVCVPSFPSASSRSAGLPSTSVLTSCRHSPCFSSSHPRCVYLANSYSFDGSSRPLSRVCSLLFPLSLLPCELRPRASLVAFSWGNMACRNNKHGQVRSGPYARPMVTAAAPAIQRGAKKQRAGNAPMPLPPSMGMPLQKKFGQHLLKNPAVLDKIVQAGDIRSSDTVLEIGPGTGNLTMRLLPVAREVVALDVDARMVSEVKKRAVSNGYMNLTVRQGDALRSDLGTFDVCAANLPYQISSHFLLRLLAHRPPFRCAVLMFQKEFGERLMAQPGDKNYCRLAANVSLFCTVHRVCKVEAKHFTPPPKVDSVVVKIIPRPKLLQLDFKEWDGLMRICFGRKNRTLHALFRRSSVLSMLESNYKTWCTLNKQVPTSSPFREYCLGVLTETGLENRRSISIDIDTYFKLLLAFNKKGIHFVNVASLPGASSVGTSGGAEPMAGIDEYFFYDEDDKGHADGGDDD